MPGLKVLQIVENSKFLLRADNHVNAGNAAQRVKADLRVAADHNHERLRMRPQHVANHVPATGFALAGHGTGVNHADIGIRAEFFHRAALLAEHVAQRGCLRLIQAAS